MAVTDLPAGLTAGTPNGPPVDLAYPIETSGEARIPPGVYKKAMAALHRRRELQAEFGGLFAAAFNGSLKPAVAAVDERRRKTRAERLKGRAGKERK